MQTEYVIKSLENYFKYKLQKNRLNKISSGWKNIYSLRNNLNNNNILKFLNPAEALLYGYNLTKNPKKIEQREIERLFLIISYRDTKKKNFIKKVKSENIFGEELLELEGIKTTRTIISNASTCYEILKLTNYFKKRIRILEIGSGYGELARQIIKYSRLKVLSYDMIDLPNAILFSELYLGKVFGTKNFETSNFVSNDSFQPKKNKYKTKINFFIPDSLKLLKSKYDLIINSYSLGEMRKSTTQEYIKIIHQKMNGRSRFISINAVKKWSIKNYSDYNYNIFNNIFTKQIDEFPPSIYGTTNLLNLFKKKYLPSKNMPSKNINNLSVFFDYGFSELMNVINQKNCNLNNNKIFFKKISLINLENIIKKKIYDFKPEELILFLKECIEGNEKFLNFFKEDFYVHLKKSLYFKYLSLNTLIKVNSKFKSNTFRRAMLSTFKTDIIRYNYKSRLKSLIRKIFYTFRNIYSSN